MLKVKVARSFIAVSMFKISTAFEKIKVFVFHIIN